jgi:predicted nuclease with RNAse H fold
MTDQRYLGIDFSGDAHKWGAGVGRDRSNVWIAEVVRSRGAELALDQLRPVQDLKGVGHPFQRLVDALAAANFVAAGIDAPFSIPRKYLPSTWRGLVDGIDRIDCGGRPFPKGESLVAFIGEGPAEKKPLRQTEKVWKDCKPRSSLWHGARGGTAFTVACLKLIARTGCPVWPWVISGPRLLVEAYPAAQLDHWQLRGESRSEVINYLAGRIELGPHSTIMVECADALDAVICSFAAMAAITGNSIPAVAQKYADAEGWIAVSP